MRSSNRTYEKTPQIDHLVRAWQITSWLKFHGITCHHRRRAEFFSGLLSQAGKLDQALEQYRTNEAIQEKLVAVDPENVEWQTDLAGTNIKIGDILIDLGKRPEALAAYEKSLSIRQKLAQADPGNADWQAAVANTYHRLAQGLLKEGRRAEALAAHRKSIAIYENLLAADQENTSWASGLAFSHEFAGQVLEAEDK